MQSITNYGDYMQKNLSGVFQLEPMAFQGCCAGVRPVPLCMSASWNAGHTCFNPAQVNSKFEMLGLRLPSKNFLRFFRCFSCQPCRIPTPEVSSHGRFRNRFGCISFGSLTSSGYLRVSIDRSMFYVHRVVAFAFLGPPPAENRWLVNHRDNNPSNNRLENLEYVSPSQNMLHSYTNSSRGTASKPVMWRTMGSQRWNMCSSGTVASQQLGVSQSSVSRCCQQKVSINGFELRFVSDGDRTIYAQEEWRPMLDTRSGEIVPGKMVSSLGRVRGKNGCVSQGYLERTGYFTTHISGFKLRNELVHRLVARAFLQPPDSPLRVQVNHRDGNKENNAAENLEYVSASENIAHCYAIGDRKVRSDGRPVESRLYGSGRDWQAHPSIAAAAQILGLRHSGISACINGRARRSGAYEFRLPIASAAPAFDGHTDEEWREVDVEGLVLEKTRRKNS